MKWKKYLVFLVVFLISFLFIDKINAQTTIPITTYSNSYYYFDEWLALRENDGYTTYHNEIFDYKNIDSNTGNVNFERLFNYGILESDTNYIFYKNERYISSSTPARNNLTGWFVVSKSNLNYFYIDSFLRDSGAMGIRVIISTQEIVIDKNTNLPILTDNSTSGFWRQQDNYFDYYNDNEYKAAWNINRIRQNYFTNYNVMYSDNTIFATKNSSVEPDIIITEDSQTTVTTIEPENKTYITSKTLRVEQTIIDDELYLLQYRWNNENWTSYTFPSGQNSFTRTYRENGTLYVRIIDTTTLETIKASTFTIATIEELPVDYVTEDTINTTPGQNDVIFNLCHVDNNYNFAVCEVEINNVDTTNYNYYYRFVPNEFIPFYPNVKGQILPQVYDPYTLNTTEDISLYRKWNNLSSNTYILNLKIYKNETIVIMIENNTTFEKKYYSFTITKAFPEDTNNNVNGLFNSFKNIFSRFKDNSIFKDIWQSFNNSNIKEYLMILIIGSIIIIIIKSSQR